MSFRPCHYCGNPVEIFTVQKWYCHPECGTAAFLRIAKIDEKHVPCVPDNDRRDASEEWVTFLLIPENADHGGPCYA